MVRTVTDTVHQHGWHKVALEFWLDKIVLGNRPAKEAAILTFFCDRAQPVSSLIVGPPGSGKTRLYEAMSELKWVSKGSANSTRAGLLMDMGTRERGLLLTAHDCMVLLDEFNRIPKDAVNSVLELMSNGKTTINSSTKRKDDYYTTNEYESRFAMLAFSNPSISGLFADPPVESLRNFPEVLLSRFALIVRMEELNDEELLRLVKMKMGDEPAHEILPIPFMNLWRCLAQTHKPKWYVDQVEKGAYQARIVDLIREYRDSPLRRDDRMADYCDRIPETIAKANLADVTGETLKEALRIVEDSLRTWSYPQGGVDRKLLVNGTWSTE